MAKVHPEISPQLRKFIEEQHMFFVASAPDSGGHVNVSPKGLDGLRVIDPQTVVYQDLTGSGNETAAHLKQNQRLTLMLCSFTKKPMILRLYGLGEILLPGGKDFEQLRPLFSEQPGLRQFVRLAVERVQTSCGFGVPLYQFQGQRDTLIDWAEKKGDAGLEDYRREKNVTSIDGLPTGLAES